MHEQYIKDITRGAKNRERISHGSTNNIERISHGSTKNIEKKLQSFEIFKNLGRNKKPDQFL